jgi:hypothetical protein
MYIGVQGNTYNVVMGVVIGKILSTLGNIFEFKILALWYVVPSFGYEEIL